MNLKKKTKQGQCKAMRCTGQDLGEGFCEKHIETARNEGLVNLSLPPSDDSVYAAGMQAGLEAADIEVLPKTAILPPFTQDIVSHTDATYKERLSEYLEYLPSFEVATQDDMDCLNGWLADIKQIEKEINAKEKQVTGPLNAGIAAARDLFRPMKKAVQDAKKLANDIISEKLRADKEAQIEALQHVEAAGGDVTADVLSIAHGQGNVETPQGTYLRTYWHVEIIDANSVPRQFCKPDEALLKAYATQTKGQMPVEGVRFYSTDTVSQRSQK